MPHIDDMQGLDDYDKVLVADMDYSRPSYSVPDDEPPAAVQRARVGAAAATGDIA